MKESNFVFEIEYLILCIEFFRDFKNVFLNYKKKKGVEYKLSFKNVLNFCIKNKFLFYEEYYIKVVLKNMYLINW